MASTRHIRDLLDTNSTGGSPTNSSTSLKIVSKYINAAKAYYDLLGYTGNFSTTPGVNGKKSGWLAVYMMGDESGAPPNYAPTSPTYDMPNTTNLFLGNFPDGHGLNAYDNYTNSGTVTHLYQNFGNETGFNYSNSGLRHLAHQVQFAKGTSFFTNGTPFITGGTNLPGIQNQGGVGGGGNLYNTYNIAFSNFRGLTKDGQQSNYIWGGSVSETTPTTGPISIGNAAVNPGGSSGA